MILKINQLMNSNIAQIREIAGLIYERDNGERGLSKDDVEEIIDLLFDTENLIKREFEDKE